MAFITTLPLYIHPHPITAGLIDHRSVLVLLLRSRLRLLHDPLLSSLQEAAEEAEEADWWEKTISSHRCDHDHLQDHPRWE